MTRRFKRGSALATVLLAGLVLFTLAKALILISHGSAFSSRAYQDRVAAGYALEAGVADAMAHLAADVDWNAGFSDEPLKHGPGTYSVEFAATGVKPGPDQSVNNLKGMSLVDGPRGDNTVPAGSAEVVVIARVGGSTRKVHVFLTGSANSSFSAGILAASRIVMSGNVTINGISDLLSGQSVAAELHANTPGNTNDVVTWDGTGTANISGKVSARSTAPNAVNLSGYTPSGGILNNAGDKTAPAVDIVSTVSANSGHPNPGLNPVGFTQVDPGEYSLTGPITINGDVNLNGAKIYVNGDVTINGSLSGSGELYITGKTVLKGDTTLSGADGVALYSHGSVELSGFDGTNYLQAVVAANPGAQSELSQTIQALQDLQKLVSTKTADDLFDSGPLHDQMDTYLEALGGWDSNNDGSAWRLADHIATSQPTSPTRDFMVQRLRDLARFGSEEQTWDPEQHWQAGDHKHDGIMLYASHVDVCLLEEIMTAVKQFDVNKLGSSYFQGSIYTNGYLYANSDVSVVGAVFATGSNAGAGGTVDGQAVNPGDIILKKGVDLTLNEETIEKFGGASASGAATIRLKSWIEM
ncbi:hypothetical protein DYH09_32655 [bacterium CPR1]|nr:hypothetical protein [bacterium CPR1]